MSKTFETKKKILRMLRERHMTLTEISEALQLAPSTVEQHLKELERMNAISIVEDEYIKKWKYYRLEGGAESANQTGMGPTRQRTIAVGIAVLAAAAFAVFFLAGSAASGYVPTNTLLIQLTDPPVVPPGTQALTIQYNGVGMHELGRSNATGFTLFNASGTVDLMSLTNVTQTIAVIKTGSNVTFDRVRFYIASATITIDNKTYNVTLPSNEVTARIGSGLNASSGGLLIDLRPVVVQIYTNDTHSVFVMVPSLAAVAVGRSRITADELHIGARSGIGNAEEHDLEEARANISITNASSSTINGSTRISVTVKNDGNSTVVLKHVLLSGYMLAVPRYPPGGVTPMGVQSGMGASLPGGEGEGVLNATAGAGTEDHGVATALHISAGAMNASTEIEMRDAELFMKTAHNTLNFLVTSTGVLVLPHDVKEEEGNVNPGDQGGYSLAAGSSVTLTFNGTISFGLAVGVDGTASGNATANVTAPVRPLPSGFVVVELIPNQTYELGVAGTTGARARATVKATGSTGLSGQGIVDVTSVQLVLHSDTNGTNATEALPGFVAQTGSYVYYTIPNYCGMFYPQAAANSSRDAHGAAGTSATCIPALSNVSFSTDTPGFTILYARSPPVLGAEGEARSGTPNGDVCAGCTVPPEHSFAYVLEIGTPDKAYAGRLEVTESYSAHAIPSPVPENSTGTNTSTDGFIRGVVSIGPLCPVENESGGCPHAVVNESTLYTSREVILTPIAAGSAAYDVAMDQHGGFKATVSAGRYELNISDCTFMGCSRVLPMTVAVEAGQTLEEHIEIDTGIR